MSLATMAHLKTGGMFDLQKINSVRTGLHHPFFRYKSSLRSHDYSLYVPQSRINVFRFNFVSLSWNQLSDDNIVDAFSYNISFITSLLMMSQL